MQRDSVLNTFVVSTCLCVVCSVLVSSAAVLLRRPQEENKVREMRKNVLLAAGLFDEKVPLEDLFKQVETRIVDLQTGQFVPSNELDPQKYDQRAAAKDPDLSVGISPEDDLAGIKRREKYSFVYLVNKDGKLDQVVLPIKGKGLWSTLYGFIALDADMQKIRGITFYEHGETPGLGGEIDNKNWKKKWTMDKLAFDDTGQVRIEVIRGNANPNSEEAKYQIDGLAGATITSQGVSRLVHYWLGEDGFKPFLEAQSAS
jgi:Na+-transporting NADH:ubiquinone oxidoreductase subunit C